MKSKRHLYNLILLTLTVFAILMTFSCTGVFLLKAKSGMGTLTIALPARDAGATGNTDGNTNQYEALVSFYKISVLSETGKADIPTRVIEKNTFYAELPVGSYSVIVQGICDGTTSTGDSEADEMFELMYKRNIPLFIGRTNNVSVTEGNTTPVTVMMCPALVPLAYEEDLDFDLDFDWGSGSLPKITTEGYTHEGWIMNNTTEITELPDTSKSNGELYLYPILEKKPAPPRSHNKFYVSQNGAGTADGLSADNPMKIDGVYQEIADYSYESESEKPEIVLVDDVTLPSDLLNMSEALITGITKSDGTKVSISGSGSSGYILDLNYSVYSWTFNNVAFDGRSIGKGIRNRGTLSLKNCEIKNCSMGLFNDIGTCTLDSCTVTACIAPDADQHAVYNYQGSLTVKNYSTISNCSSQLNGGGIYCQGSSSSLSFDSTSSITGCTAVSAGGGIYINSDANGSAIRICGSIANCSAASGGGICNYGQGELQLSGCTITGCKATGEDVDKRGNGTGYGGGIFTGQAISFDNTTSIKDCTATEHGNSIYGQVNSTFGTAAKVNGTAFTKSAYYDGDVENTTSLTFTDM